MRRFGKNKRKFILGLIVSLGILATSSNLAFADEYEFKTHKIVGKDRFETSAKILEKGYYDSYTITVVNGNMYADAIVAAPYAKFKESNIVLVEKDRIPTVVKNQLKKSKPKEAIIIGGQGVVSKKVEDELKSMGIKIKERIGGKDRFETCLRMGKKVVGEGYGALLVENNDWRNALALTPVASVKQIPIFYSNGKTLPKGLKEMSDDYGYSFYAVGELENEEIDHRAMELSMFSVLAKGLDKTDTNMEIYETFKLDIPMRDIYLVGSENYADALSISPVAGGHYGFIAFVDDKNAMRWGDFFYKYGGEVENIYVIGGGISDRSLEIIQKNIDMIQASNAIKEANGR